MDIRRIVVRFFVLIDVCFFLVFDWEDIGDKEFIFCFFVLEKSLFVGFLFCFIFFRNWKENNFSFYFRKVVYYLWYYSLICDVLVCVFMGFYFEELIRYSV